MMTVVNVHRRRGMLDIIRQDHFAPLSWGARVARKDGHVTAYAGPAVDTVPNGFIEGCHTGDALLDDVLSACFCAATGMILDGGRPVFFTASHTLDPLYIVEGADEVYISNSLPCVLGLSGRQFDPDYLYYAADFSSIHNHIETAPLQGGGHVQAAFNINVRFGSSGVMILEQKQSYGPFPDFKSYEDALKDVLERCARHAARPDRRVQYKPVTTISSGYDSVAISALAKEVLGGALKYALTIRDAGKNLGNDNDSGQDNALALGLTPIEKGRLDYKDNPRNELLYSIIGTPQDIALGAFNKELENGLLLRGDHGDVVWAYNIKPSYFYRKEPSGVNGNEARHHMRFINLPLAFVGCMHHADLIRISKSEEMVSWRLNNSYDRPIARRLAEERGIRRETFGQEKKAIAVSLRADQYFSDELLSELDARWHALLQRNRGAVLQKQLMHMLYQIQIFLINKMVSIIRRLGNKTYNFKKRYISRRHVSPADKTSVLAQWCLEKLVLEYPRTDGGKTEKSDSAPEKAAVGG